MPSLIEAGLDGIEVWHPDLSGEERLEAYKTAVEYNLYISGGSDHSGLCGGYYDSFESEAALKNSPLYIKPMSAGTSKEFFDEIKNREKRSREDYTFSEMC